MLIGFMQGRLCERVDGKIQAFPWSEWKDEFARAERLGFPCMEWTIDHDRFWENPLIAPECEREIRALSTAHNVRITSLTSDAFMQAPFFKAEASERAERLRELDATIDACSRLGVGIVVIPLVDNGSVADAAHEEDVVATLSQRADLLRRASVRIAFESDFPPARLLTFIRRFPNDCFGINYDIGNSAALGYDHTEEIAAYGPHIFNVHVKDRVRGGTTVPLGTGSADGPAALRALRQAGYRDLYILQTARADDGDHEGALTRNRDVLRGWAGA